MTRPVIDRSAARAQLLARYHDEQAGPPFPGAAAVRCTEHGAFIVWCSPPAPPGRVACPARCAT